MEKKKYGNEWFVIEPNGNVTMYLGHPRYAESTRIDVSKAVKLGMCIERKDIKEFDLIIY